MIRSEAGGTSLARLALASGTVAIVNLGSVEEEIVRRKVEILSN